jgi:exonuclease III
VRGINNQIKRNSVFKWARKKDFDILLLQETYSSENDEKMWCDEWGGKILFAHGSKHSKGIMVLFKPNLDLEITMQQIDPNGRYVAFKIKIENKEFTLANIYAPNKLAEKKTFFAELMNMFGTMGTSADENIICGGDWNSIYNTKLDKSGGKSVHEDMVPEMKSLLELLDLIDVWRIRNPTARRFTFRQKTPLVQTRLDYFLTSNGVLDMVSDAEVIPSVCSDHSCITLKVKFLPENTKGRGYWKFNSQHTSDEEFRQCVTELINNCIINYADIVDKRVMWELIKYEIRKFCIKYGAKKRRELNVNTGNLLKSLNDLEIQLGTEPSLVVQNEYESIKEQLNELEAERSKGTILRSKAKWIEEGEKPTKYFFSLEKQNYIKKHVRKLKLPDGSTTTDPEEILQIQKSFYETLYTAKQSNNETEIAYFMRGTVPMLSENLKMSCEGKVTVEECHKNLKQFKNNKSPGNDGLTAEFYKTFWPTIANTLIQCYNYLYEHGELSNSQKQAIISLIEKQGKDREFIQNWRPISLLNVDYKILTKTLASRIKVVLPHLISIDQTGYVEGRQLSHTVRLIQDIMAYTKQENISGILLQIDFEKAFDSIEWEFLIQALKRFNFGDSFIKWVNVIYTNISSCIINNGTTTPYFKLSRSVRQGDPLSGYLFIIALELLAQKIRESQDVQGIRLGSKEIRITQYVDDLTVFVENINSANQVFTILKKFHKAAGLKINMDKTEAMWLGRDRASIEKPIKIKWPKEPIKALGIYLSYNELDAERANFDNKIEKLKRQLHWWKARDLSLLGRVLIVKTIALSKFTHLASIIVIPQKVIKEVNSLIYEFVWQGKRDKIKRDILVQDYDNGGLKMIDFDMVIKAAKVNWIKEYLDPHVNATWKNNMDLFCQAKNLNILLQSNFCQKELPCTVPKYYMDSINFWREMKFEEKNDEQLVNHFIWYNKNVKLENKTIFNKRLFTCGMWYATDLYMNGNLIPFQTWLARGAQYMDYLTWRGIVASIPDEWKRLIVQNHVQILYQDKKCGILYDNTFIPVNKIAQKDIKNWQRWHRKQTVLKAKEKYNEKFTVISQETWQNVYTLAKDIIMDNKIIEMQYKILHRIIGTNKMLYRIGKIASPVCRNCEMYVETIEHIFYECLEVKNFWLNLTTLWNRSLDRDIEINCKNILLGYKIDNAEEYIIDNIFILYAKKYIYKCKMDEKQPNVHSFKQYMKSCMNIILLTNYVYKSEYEQIRNFITENV